MKEYPKPTVQQSIDAWHLLLDLIDVGYPHNFQLERRDIVDYMYSVSKLVKRAYKIKEGE